MPQATSTQQGVQCPGSRGAQDGTWPPPALGARAASSQEQTPRPGAAVSRTGGLPPILLAPGPAEQLVGGIRAVRSGAFSQADNPVPQCVWLLLIPFSLNS